MIDVIDKQASGLPNSWWQSPVLTVQAGDGGANPFPPAYLNGLGDSPVYLNGVVPEPSVFALGGLGAVLALYRLNRRTGAAFGRHPASRNSIVKARFLTLLAVLSLLIASTQSKVFSQGTVDFENINVNVPVYQTDMITRLSGPQFLAELFAGLSVTNLSGVATTSFLTGNVAGYFRAGRDGTVTLTGISPGEATWVQVDVWNTTSGSSFAQAQASGLPNSWWQSSVFTLVAGGGGINPFPPAVLTGLGNSPVFLNGVVPEPSVFALGALGAVLALFCLNRRTGAASGRHPASRIPS